MDQRSTYAWVCRLEILRVRHSDLPCPGVLSPQHGLKVALCDVILVIKISAQLTTDEVLEGTEAAGLSGE